MVANISRSAFCQVVSLPSSTPVLDLSQGLDISCLVNSCGIGQYNEKRLNMYTMPLFNGTRNIHMGVDFFAPTETPVYAFTEGIIHSVAFHPNSGDYGFTVVTQHQLNGEKLYALYGHLNAASIIEKQPGQHIKKGEVIGWLGDRQENGGWHPHLHFQLSWIEPVGADLPGVVSDDQRETALQIYPDPWLVLKCIST